MTSQSLSPSLELTTIGATVTTNPSKVQNTATLTLKYVLLTVCTHEKENEVETTVHARIVTQSEEWPGLCRDDKCSNAFVTATCDGTYSKSITTIVEIKQVPDTLPSKVNQTAVSTEIVLVRAAQDDAFDLKTIDAVLKKAEVLIKLIKTCTRGYTYTGTECVKQDEPSSSSTVVLGASIGGVFGFLVVLILVVLVVVIYRRLGWQHAGRQARQDDEHDYSALAIAGQSTASGHSGRQGPMQLSPLGFELDNSSFGKQHERPVSDYDVIGLENPNIASLLTKTCSADEDPCNPYDECDGYDEAGHGDGKVQNSPPEKAANRKEDGSDYLTPSMPRESTDAENPPDYLTLYSPQDMSDDVNYSDYLTPQPKLEKSDDPNYSD
ncbi:uncharacterized protein [Littorina saxatilis]|uniref:uncharacterized protein n=1 Tax=Littorina saxatilis TaxID=31220 RepID=UPI0038B4AFB2